MLAIRSGPFLMEPVDDAEEKLKPMDVDVRRLCSARR
jgi:hypothetical protein